MLEVLQKCGYLFYIASPNRTTFETAEEVPQYLVEIVPYFVALFFVEIVVRKLQRKPDVRVNDVVASVSQGLLAEYLRIFFSSWVMGPYIYIYNNWRIVNLPWDSLWTWWLCFFAVDFMYYWGHRALHEINFLWAAHQVHHSSEDFNLPVAVRQSVVQHYLTPVGSLPLAFVIPPSAMMVHTMFNLIYQYWIHTEIIGSLGPLEYIMNTASHHRVHHGRNRDCIDKNYAGTLIIWDRMFGTFEAEKQKVTYGLTHPLKSFSPWYIQFCNYAHIWKTAWNIKGWKNTLSVIFKGPGWTPGSPWRGNIDDIPEVIGEVEKYDPPSPRWFRIYIASHYLLLIVFHLEIMESQEVFPKTILYFGVAYQLLSLTVIAFLLERRMYAPWLELLRCFLYFPLDLYFLPYSRISLLSPIYQLLFRATVRVIFIFSSVFWLTQYTMNITTILHTKGKKLQ